MKMLRLAAFAGTVLSCAGLRTSLPRGMTARSVALRLGRDARGRTSPRMAMAGLWTGYLELLATQPLLTKSVTASVIIGAGDSAAQLIERSQAKERIKAGKKAEVPPLDLVRIVRWAFFGLVLQAPWNHYFYVLLDQALPPTVDPFTLTNLGKVTIDQFGQSPIFTALCFIFLGALEGKNKGEIKAQLDREYVPTLLTSWKLWLPAAFLNIGFVPPELRVLFINLVFFGWTVYLSLVVNKATPEAEVKKLRQ